MKRCYKLRENIWKSHCDKDLETRIYKISKLKSKRKNQLENKQQQ